MTNCTGALYSRPMACFAPRELVELLGPAAMGVLHVDEWPDLARHLEQCPTCAAELRALHRVVIELDVLKRRGSGWQPR